MLNLIAQAAPRSFFNAPANSGELWMKILLALVVGVVVIFGLMSAPQQLRRPLIVGITFLSGLFYFLLWIYPSPIDRQPDEAPRDAFEGFSFWLTDAQPVVATLTNIIAGFLIGLGVYSLLRIHLRRVLKQQRDWGFSAVLLVCLVSMTAFGYWDWAMRQGPTGSQLDSPAYWTVAQYGRDILFDGLFQQMEAAMFSTVAFYILSAAYRAFRARSVEATILLITALIVVLSVMGAVEFVWNNAVNSFAGDNALLQNLRLTEIAGWIKDNLQTASIRGIEFGVGIGLLAMGIRLWLSLEKTTGGNS